MVYTRRPYRLSFHAPRGVAERRRQAVQYAVSQDAPRYRVVSWVDFRVRQMNLKLERRVG